MSRSLPTHPSLEHLKKQAKEFLSELRKQRPDANLADAQHEVAREYGFANWTTLKARVESLQGSSTRSPFVGMWNVNVEKSKRHPQNPFQSATLRFAVDGNTVRITHVVVDESGKEERAENDIQVDGLEHRDPDRPDYTVVASWRGMDVLDQHLVFDRA